jgi:protein TonB
MSDDQTHVVLPRHKRPEADLRQGYKKHLWISLAGSVLLHALIFGIFPALELSAYAKKHEQVILQIEDIPETRQDRRPPPAPRPVVPIASDSEDIPDDATIETTDVDFFDDLAAPPALEETAFVELEEEEDEIVEIWKVEKQPEYAKQVKPDYPEIAKKAGIEGTITIHVLINKKGMVEAVGKIDGPGVFHEAARAAALQYEFTPAIQNDKPVKVWVALRFKFQLRD